MQVLDKRYVIGVDYGTDSCRAILLDAADGTRIAESSCAYPRWKKGLYCDPLIDRYRQHPQDYIDTFKTVIKDIVSQVKPEVVCGIGGISFDTTASTPVLVDEAGTPLSLLPEFSEEPDAMFVSGKIILHWQRRMRSMLLLMTGRWITLNFPAVLILRNGDGPKYCIC